LITACNNASSSKENSSAESRKKDIREEAITYNIGDTVFNAYITYDHNDTAKRPAVIVVPEWWGLNEYVRGRAKQLAEMGYVAMAVDMYGAGKIAADPAEAEKLATPFYMNPALSRQRLDAALAKLTSYQETDTARVAAIGYCFGGFVALNAAKLGSHLAGVVSFHGGLGGAPATKELLRARLLICHGGSDNFVPQQEVDAFKKGMDSIGASYAFKVYPNATHAFTNPNATAVGQQFKMPIEYNAAADSASWNDMKVFFGEMFK
jgi:dienelactone hydrolase